MNLGFILDGELVEFSNVLDTAKVKKGIKMILICGLSD